MSLSDLGVNPSQLATDYLGYCISCCEIKSFSYFPNSGSTICLNCYILQQQSKTFLLRSPAASGGDFGSDEETECFDSGGTILSSGNRPRFLNLLRETDPYFIPSTAKIRNTRNVKKIWILNFSDMLVLPIPISMWSGGSGISWIKHSYNNNYQNFLWRHKDK